MYSYQNYIKWHDQKKISIGMTQQGKYVYSHKIISYGQIFKNKRIFSVLQNPSCFSNTVMKRFNCLMH